MSWSGNPFCIVADSNNVVVQFKEKYGGYHLDTCTILMVHAGHYVTIKREGPSGWYPIGLYSFSVLGQLSPEQGISR